MVLAFVNRVFPQKNLVFKNVHRLTSIRSASASGIRIPGVSSKNA